MRVNRPRQMVLKDEVLAQIAMTVPHDARAIVAHAGPAGQHEQGCDGRSTSSR
jgi:hypothetical protein